MRPTRLRYARRDLADHLKGLSSEELAKFTPRKLDKFFADFVKENPDFAIPTPSADVEPTPPPKKAIRTKPVNTGNGGKKPKPAPADGPGLINGKTVKPGLANSMDKKELRAHMQKPGVQAQPLLRSPTPQSKPPLAIFRGGGFFVPSSGHARHCMKLSF